MKRNKKYKEIVYAKWIWVDGSFCNRECICSHCNNELPAVLVSMSTLENPYPETEYIEPTMYCPNCGALMIEER